MKTPAPLNGKAGVFEIKPRTMENTPTQCQSSRPAPGDLTDLLYRPPDASDRPSHRLFGPPALSPDHAAEHAEAVARARKWARAAAEHVPAFARIDEALADCRPSSTPHLIVEQRRPYNRRRLAKVGHLLDLTPDERRRLYGWADYVDLSDRCAGHLLGRLKRARRADQ